MDTETFMKFMAMGLALWGVVNILMKFMPEYATQLPLPVYEFFYSITVNTEPSPTTETMPLKTTDPDCGS